VPTPLGMMTNSATYTTRDWSGDDDHGAPVIDTSNTSSAFACSIQPQSSSEGIEYSRASGTKRLVMYYPSTQTIKHGDVVTSGGVVYKVVGPPRDVAGRGVFFEIDLEQEASG
jgi:hypothetical protein